MEDIRINKLSKVYETRTGDVTAVRDLTLVVQSGSVFGFLGPNGAGKTTTIKMLVGLAEPTEGEIVIAGGSPNTLSVRAEIGFMPESPAFYLYLTGYEFLEFVADIFGLQKNNAKNNTKRDGRIEEVLEMVNLTEAKRRQIRTYSKGMLQRLGLAQALLNDPRILFLDEPLDGLDPLGRAEIKSIFIDLKKKGKTIFFNSHILADVAEICDTVGIIDKGTLIAHGSPKELTVGHRDLEAAFVDIISRSRASAKTSL